MNFPLIISGLILILIGSLATGIGWNWDKIKKKNTPPQQTTTTTDTKTNQQATGKTTMQASTSGNNSPIFQTAGDLNINTPTNINME